MSKDPQSQEEWQEAADAAVFAIAIHAGQVYGLIARHMVVDVARCEEILDWASKIPGVEIRTIDEIRSARFGGLFS